jgi:hypothetical protein
MPVDEQVPLEGGDTAVHAESGDCPGEVKPGAGRAVVPFAIRRAPRRAGE